MPALDGVSFFSYWTISHGTRTGQNHLDDGQMHSKDICQKVYFLLQLQHKMCACIWYWNCWSKAYVCFYLYQSLRLDFGQPPAAAGCLGSLPLPTSAVISPHSLMETIVKLQRNRSRKTTDQEEIMTERSLCKGKPTATSINSIFLDSVVFIAVDCLWAISAIYHLSCLSLSTKITM